MARIMAILNCTPDSFSDGGQLTTVDAAISAGAAAVAAGAAWLDVGGESARPGSNPVDTAEQIRRTAPVIAGLRQHLPQMPISIDTTDAAVAAAALAAGATAINDISGGDDPQVLRLAAEQRCGLMLMHRSGPSSTMQDDPRYGDVLQEVGTALERCLSRAMAAGVARDRLWADPGIGFGKTVAHNLALLRGLPALRQRLGVPLLVGISRKRFLAQTAGTVYPAPDAVGHPLHALIAPWCDLLRVHDVPGTMQALTAAGVAPSG